MGELDNHINKKKNKKGKNKKKRNRLVKLFPILFLIILAIVLIGVSGVAKVKKIEIKSNGKNVSIAEIKSLSGLSENMNMFEFRLSTIEESIKNNSYIESVQVKRHFNGTVSIEVTERKPIYRINYAGGYILIDSGGYVLEIISDEIDLPVLLGTSTDFSSLTVGSSENKVNRLNGEDLEKIKKANSIIEISKNNNIGNLISRIDISDDKNYVVYLDSELKIVYLGDCSELNTRILCMKEIVNEESGIKGEIFIDGDLNINPPRFRESV